MDTMRVSVGSEEWSLIFTGSCVKRVIDIDNDTLCYLAGNAPKPLAIKAAKHVMHASPTTLQLCYLAGNAPEPYMSQAKALLEA